MEKNFLNCFLKTTRPQFTVQQAHETLRKRDKMRRTVHHESVKSLKPDHHSQLQIVSPFSLHRKGERNCFFKAQKSQGREVRKITDYLRKKNGLLSLEQIAKKNLLLKIKKKQNFQKHLTNSPIKNKTEHVSKSSSRWQKEKCQPHCGLFKIKCSYCKPRLDCFNIEFQKFLRENNLWILNSARQNSKDQLTVEQIKRYVLREIINGFRMNNQFRKNQLKDRIISKIENRINTSQKIHLLKWFERIYNKFQEQIKNKNSSDQIGESLKNILEKMTNFTEKCHTGSVQKKQKLKKKKINREKYRHSADPQKKQDNKIENKDSLKGVQAVSSRQKFSLFKKKNKYITSERISDNHTIKSDDRNLLLNTLIKKKQTNQVQDEKFKKQSFIKKVQNYLQKGYQNTPNTSYLTESSEIGPDSLFLGVKKKPVRKPNFFQESEFGINFPDNFERDLIQINETQRRRMKRRFGILKYRRLSRQTIGLNVLKLKIEQNRKAVCKVESVLRKQGFSDIIIQEEDCNFTRLRKIHYLKKFRPPNQLTNIFKKYLQIIEQHQQTQIKKFQKKSSYLMKIRQRQQAQNLYQPEQKVQENNLITKKDFQRGLLFYDLVKTDDIPIFQENTNFLKKVFNEKQIELQYWAKAREQLQKREKLESLLFGRNNSPKEFPQETDAVLAQKDLGKLMIVDN